MSETKLKHRIKNAAAAFFNAEFTEQNSMVIADKKSLSQKFHSSEFSEKADKTYRFFKKAFLFLPGVLAIHFSSITFALFFDSAGSNLSIRLFWIGAGIFMVWAGIGDLKNKKHPFISLPNAILGLAIGTALNYLPVSAFNYALFLIPVFFITPILVKDAIDIWDENESRLTNPETML